LKINEKAIRWLFAKREEFLIELSVLKIFVNTVLNRPGGKSEVEQILAQFIFECFFEKLFQIYEEEKKNKHGGGLVVLLLLLANTSFKVMRGYKENVAQILIENLAQNNNFEEMVTKSQEIKRKI
jgi:hypothetical protein